MVLGGLERAEHRLLERHARGVLQAARLRDRRRAPRAADRARRRAGRRRQRRQVHAAISSSTVCAARTTPPAQTGTPLDFISFHAKGAPSFVDGHVRMGIASQLRTIDHGFARIASFPELKAKPIVIGESDPDGCAAARARNSAIATARCTRATPRPASRENIYLAEKHGVNLEGALTWAFEFEDQPYFAGFRALASNGIDLPVLNVFRMFGEDVRPAARRGEQRRRVALDASCATACAARPTSSALASLATQEARASWSGTITTTTFPAPTPDVSSRSMVCPSRPIVRGSRTTASTTRTAMRTRVEAHGLTDCADAAAIHAARSGRAARTTRRAAEPARCRS